MAALLPANLQFFCKNNDPCLYTVPNRSQNKIEGSPPTKQLSRSKYACIIEVQTIKSKGR